MPILTCLLAKRVLGEGLIVLVVDVFKFVDGVDAVEDGCGAELVEDGCTEELVGDGDADKLVEDGGAEDLVDGGAAEELVETEAIILRVVPDGAYPKLVCIIAGPNENKRDGVEQHPKESDPRQQ